MNSNLSGLNENSVYDIPKISNDQIFDIDEWYFHIEKIGKNVIANISIKGTMNASSSMVKLCTIPEKYRPKYNAHESYCTQYGNPMLISIFTNGDVLLHNGSKEVNNYFLRKSLSWFTN